MPATEPSRTFLLSRSDGIGDVVLSLPVAARLRLCFPSCRIVFLGRSYTRPVVEACEHVDSFLAWDEGATLARVGADVILHLFPRKEIARAASTARIPIRIGSSHRWFHWLYCNRRPSVPRKGSNQHEAELNLRLLEGLEKEAGNREPPWTLDRIGRSYGLTKLMPLPPDLAGLLSRDRFNLILHPRSHGSARKWGLNRMSELIGLLPPDRFSLFITGSREEGESMRGLLERHGATRARPAAGGPQKPRGNLVDLTGALTVTELISFIAAAGGVVACSTGPLHLAAALGRSAIGLYAPFRPVWPARWAPLGPRARVLTADRSCRRCRRGQACDCMGSISPAEVCRAILEEARAPAGPPSAARIPG